MLEVHNFFGTAFIIECLLGNHFTDCLEAKNLFHTIETDFGKKKNGQTKFTPSLKLLLSAATVRIKQS